MIYYNFVVTNSLYILYYFLIPLLNKKILNQFKFAPKLNYHDCSQMRMTRLFTSQSDTIRPKWHWHGCSQKRLTKSLPSDTGTIALKWCCQEWFQGRLVQLFLSEISMIVPKWLQYNCFQVSLTRRLPSETGTTVLKWHQYNCFNVTMAQLFPSEFWFSNLDFAFCLYIYIYKCDKNTLHTNIDKIMKIKMIKNLQTSTNTW